MVMGDRSQLEQGFFNLLVHAEQSLIGAPEKSISIGSKVTGKQICITIDYYDRSGDLTRHPIYSRAAATAMPWDCRSAQGIVQGHGGRDSPGPQPAHGLAI